MYTRKKEINPAIADLEDVGHVPTAVGPSVRNNKNKKTNLTLAYVYNTHIHISLYIYASHVLLLLLITIALTTEQLWAREPLIIRLSTICK